MQNISLLTTTLAQIEAVTPQLEVESWRDCGWKARCEEYERIAGNSS
jgi:hypothetical protein